MGEFGRAPYSEKIYTELTSGSVEQRLDKIALYLAATAGQDSSDVVHAGIAEKVNRQILEGPFSD